MARTSPLADPEFATQVAEAFSNGATVEQMKEIFGITHPTVAKWRRDPRVKRIAMKLTEDRILRVTRRTDSIIEQRLQKADELDIKDIIAIRKEFLGGALRAQTERADEETIGEAQDWMLNNPELVDQLRESMENAKNGG